MGKTYARHRTIHASLKRAIEALRAIPGISRVILGPSRGIRHNRPVGSLQLQTDVLTGIRMVGFSDRGVSEFYVITSDVPNVRLAIAKKFAL